MLSLRASAVAVLVLAAACDDGGAGDGGARDANVVFDAGDCGDAGCAPGLACCAGACVNPVNDPHHCGACDVACPGPSPFCASGACAQAPCNPGQVCSAPGQPLCCGSACCRAGDLCCEVDRGGPSRGPECVAPIAGTCPIGCPLCL
ncbi:MAG TPA: hypothetical protein VFF06_04615 [Polyangia bacterium]|nr:hypothetical protein [Polyangia bacterium]